MKSFSQTCRVGIATLAVSLAGVAGSSLAQSWSPVQGPGTPGYGGVVRFSSGSPDGGLWIMTDGGGLHKSADGGANWTASNNGLGNLRVKTGLLDTAGTTNTNSSTYKVFAGTYGSGVFKSIDGGANWGAINNGLGCTYINAIRAVSTRLLAGADCQAASGVYYSDPGVPWVLASGLPADSRVNSISRINPTGTDYLLANTNNGIYKSTDTGATWTALPSSPSGPNGAVIYSVAYSYIPAASTPLLLIATVEGAGIFTSSDQGVTWAASNSGLPANPVPLSGASNDGTANLWWVSIDGAGVYKSIDRAASWTLFVGPDVLPAPRNIAQSGTTLFAQTLAGPYKSTDNGVTWNKGGAGLAGGWTNNLQLDSTGKFYASAADGIYQLSNGLWDKLPNLPSMANGHVLVRGITVYAVTSSAGVFKLNAGQWLAMNSGLPANLVYSSPNLRVDSASADGLYLGLYGAGVFYSANGGGTWTARNTGLSGDALNVQHMATAGALAYVSTAAGVYKSTDSGQNWAFVFAPKNAASQNLPAGHLWIDQATPSTVYAAVYNTDALGVSMASNGVWKSTDNGVNWVQLPGLAGKKVRDVRILGADNTLAAGVWDDGIAGGFFISNDGGQTWQSMSTGLTSNLINSATDGGNSGGYVATRGAGLFSFVDAQQSDEWKYFGAWTNGGPISYGVSYGARDINQALSGITVSGGNQTATASYWTDQSWHADIQFGTTLPPVDTVYTATVTPKTGTVTSTTFSMRSTGYSTAFPTNIQPSGGANVSVSAPVFTWSPPVSGGTLPYGINVNRVADNVQIWSAFDIIGNSVTYAGPALVAGTLYQVIVQTQDFDKTTNATYGAMRAETFCFQCTGTGGSTTGTNYDQIFIARNTGMNPENFGVGVRYPRASGDSLASYLIQCPNNASAQGPFNSATVGAGYEWINVSLGTTQPTVPFNCTSTVTYGNGTTNVATLTVDRFADGAAYPGTISIVPNSNVASLASITFTSPANTRVQSNFWSMNAGGSLGDQLWFVGSTSSPMTYTGPALTPGTQYTIAIASVDGTTTMHAAQVFVPFCYQCGGTSGGGNLNLVAGWNLVGNSNNATLDVATVFGNTSQVTTVWKWVPASSKWALYAPSMSGTALAAYAVGKSYDVLTSVAGGEGFWVNAVAAFSATLPAGSPITSGAIASSLGSGWSLISTGDDKTPRAFNNSLSPTPPSAGVVAAPVLTTLWAWNSAKSSWYFYAPSLDNSNGLAAYAATKGYLDFGTATLAPGNGFWVNKP